MRLSNQGTLSRSSIYFGVSTDPFYPFDGKFDATMKFLQLFQRYTPGQLVVQTRSPLIVIAMPVLRGLGKHAAVTIGVETPDQEAANRYTPGLPRIEERLRAATTLRRMGVEVTLQCAPVLPYGDWKNDARKFAETLCEHGDYVYVQGVSDGSEASERRVRNTPLARKLAQDRKFHWLRKDAATPLLNEIEKIGVSKLLVPERKHLQQRQLSVFVA
jgi:DNA repair photolyase